MDYLRLPVGDSAPERVNVVVEIPRGQTNKYEYDPELQVFRLSRPLYSSVLYPGDYGFVPRTLSEDGDAVDALILVDNPSFPGCLVEMRPIGILDMVDKGKRDDKVLGVSAESPAFRGVTDRSDVAPHLLREIEHFFQIYKQLEGFQPKLRGWRGAGAAHKFLRQAHERFERKESRRTN